MSDKPRKATVEWVSIEDEPQICAWCEEYVETREASGGWWYEPVGDGTVGVIRVKHVWCWDGMDAAAHDYADGDFWWDRYVAADLAERRSMAEALAVEAGVL